MTLTSGMMVEITRTCGGEFDDGHEEYYRKGEVYPIKRVVKLISSDEQALVLKDNNRFVVLFNAVKKLGLMTV